MGDKPERGESLEFGDKKKKKHKKKEITQDAGEQDIEEKGRIATKRTQARKRGGRIMGR